MPSLIKQLMVEEVRPLVADAPALIFVDSSRLKSDEVLGFRSKLRKAGGRLRVGKGSVLRRVLPEGCDKLLGSGPVGMVAIKQDIAAVAKLVNELVKDEKITLKGAVLEGRPLDAKSAARLSDLPTREQASASLVRCLQAPMVQLLRIVQSKPNELVRLLKVKSEEKPA